MSVCGERVPSAADGGVWIGIGLPRHIPSTLQVTEFHKQDTRVTARLLRQSVWLQISMWVGQQALVLLRLCQIQGSGYVCENLKS